MDISSINNIGFTMTNPLTAVAGDATSLPNSGLPPAAMGRMDQLVQMIQGFSSSEVLMALMMAQPQPAAQHHATHHATSFATAAFGLANSMQMAGMAMGAVMSAAVGASVGASISVQG
ncbi:MAG: hypothetical protein JSS49_03605 [Planctomycetes bacterium]|nr:hypothetical protein [Planctomycetota bacterium]